MMRTQLSSLAVLAIFAFGSVALAAPGDSEGPGMERMQVWAPDHEAMLIARLAGLKAGLKLTPDQEKLWPPFEAAIRDDAKLRMDLMKGRMERMQNMREMDMTQPAQSGSDMNNMASNGMGTTPVDRLEALAKRMSERGSAMLNVAEAAKPLYASLDDSQKRLFALLGGEMLMTGHARHGMGMMGRENMGMNHGGGMGMVGNDCMGRMRGDSGTMGDEGMGMMQGGHSGMRMMRNQPDDEGDNSEDR